MTTTEVSATCMCGSLSPAVVLCPDHHRYYRQGQHLTSVSSVLRTVWPQKLCECGAAMYGEHRSGCQVEARVAHARDRGILVDALFCQYVHGQEPLIPVGTPTSVIEEGTELFYRLQDWWTPAVVETQVILADELMAGTCDLLFVAERGIYDLKCTYDINAEYPLQVGLYGLLYEKQYGAWPEQLGIIHCTKRNSKPEVIRLDVAETLRDAAAIREAWRVIQRRGDGRVVYYPVGTCPGQGARTSIPCPENHVKRAADSTHCTDNKAK